MNYTTSITSQAVAPQTFDDFQNFMNNVTRDLSEIVKEMNELKQVIEFLSFPRKEQMQKFQSDYMGIRSLIYRHIMPIPEYLEAVNDHEAL